MLDLVFSGMLMGAFILPTVAHSIWRIHRYRDTWPQKIRHSHLDEVYEFKKPLYIVSVTTEGGARYLDYIYQDGEDFHAYSVYDRDWKRTVSSHGYLSKKDLYNKLIKAGYREESLTDLHTTAVIQVRNKSAKSPSSPIEELTRAKKDLEVVTNELRVAREELEASLKIPEGVLDEHEQVENIRG